MTAQTGRLLAEYDEHRQHADTDLDAAATLMHDDRPMLAAHGVARAQVHATLAQAAATVLLAETVADPDT